jgi:hypothetical protein
VTEAKNQEVSKEVSKKVSRRSASLLRLSSSANPLLHILIYCAVILISLFYITTKTFSKYITNTTIIFKILILYYLWGVFQYTEILLGSLSQAGKHRERIFWPPIPPPNKLSHHKVNYKSSSFKALSLPFLQYRTLVLL